jgi:Fe-S-cluster containining protein
MNSADFDMDTAGFECRRCGNCCRIEGFVRLADRDVRGISASLGVSEDDFTARFADLAPDRRSLQLKDRADGACIMLTDSGSCRIYPVRPKMCRTFPHDWVNITSAEYCPALAEIAARRTSSES